MRGITRRQLIGAATLGVTGGVFWKLSRFHTQQQAAQFREFDAIRAVNIASQQLFNSINVNVPTNLARV